VTQPIERDAIYRRRRFPRDVIETCVRWYLTYRLSYRDLVSLMAEREVHVTQIRRAAVHRKARIDRGRRVRLTTRSYWY
jgi:transposase-like protein